MNKKSVTKYKHARRKKEKPEITPEHHKKNVERVVDMLMSVMERLPANPAPVSETLDELISQLKTGVERSPVIVNHHTGEIIRYNLDGSQTVLNSGAAGSVAVLNPADNTKFESTAEDENSTAKMIADVKRERFEKSIEKNFTLYDSGDAENFSSGSSTFTESEKLILEQLQK